MITTEKTFHSTWIEIDLERLKANARALKSIEPNILAVIKANAYGHGLIEMAKALAPEVSYLGVSSVVEALELKEHNIQAPIFMFGQLLPNELQAVIGEGITLSVSSLEQAKLIDQISFEKKATTPIHIKVDTGMGRLGIPFRKAIGEIESISKLTNVYLEGLYTHFPSAEKEDGFTEEQLYNFSLLIQALELKEIRFNYRHAANSSAALRLRNKNLNLIRPGLSLYGLYPEGSVKSRVPVQPVLSLKSRITMIKRIVMGESVGYGRDFIADKPTNIATIPIGYSHGYPLKASGQASVLINGKLYALAGRISMDYLCINLGDDFANVGTEVILIGENQTEKITASDLASWADTIPYEILTGLNTRIPRVYL